MNINFWVITFENIVVRMIVTIVLANICGSWDAQDNHILAMGIQHALTLSIHTNVAVTE